MSKGAKKAKKTNWLRITICVLLVCAVAGTALSAAMFLGNPDPTCAYSSIQLSFEGAANGLAPNGNELDVDALRGEELVSNALEAAGFSGVYTPDQIRGSLVVRGVYPEKMAEKVMSYESLLKFTASRELNLGDYHPTTYSVALYNDFDRNISQSDLQKIADSLTAAWKNWFAQAGANKVEIDGTKVFDLERADYPQMIQILEGRINDVVRQADEMYENRPTFRLNGQGFNDISVRLNKLLTSDLERLSADITMNGYTRDKARLITQYQFEIKDLSIRLGKQQTRLERVEALLESYEKNEVIYLSTADSLTKIDGNSSATYDQLTAERKAVADEMTELKTEMARYQLKMNDLLGITSENQDAASSQDMSESQTTAETVETAVTDASAEETADIAAIASETESSVEAAVSADDLAAMSTGEIKSLAEQAVALTAERMAAAESRITELFASVDTCISDFDAMVKAYNAEQINDITVVVTPAKISAPKLLSGAFVKKTIKTAGPICAVGFMICMVLIIIDRRKEEKAMAEA